MRTRSRLPVAVAAFLVALGAVGSSPASALSCAVHPNASPEAIASGSEDLSTDRAFFDVYDFAIVGTVTGIETVGEGLPDYGATTVRLDVAAVLGDGPSEPQIDVSSPDPGGMAGYPYEVGRAYFIPVQEVGPGGEPNYSFLCDPISEVDVTITDDLALLAEDRGLAFWSSAEALDEPPADAPADDGSPILEEPADAEVAPGSSVLPVAIGITAGLALVVVVVGLAALRVRHRRGSAAR